MASNTISQATGQFSNCGPGVDNYELSYNCGGPSCGTITGFQGINCNSDGGDAVSCSNDVKCPPGVMSFQSNFTFSQNADGTVTVTDATGLEGADILDGMEAIYFAGDQVWSSIEGLFSVNRASASQGDEKAAIVGDHGYSMVMVEAVSSDFVHGSGCGHSMIRGGEHPGGPGRVDDLYDPSRTALWPDQSRELPLTDPVAPTLWTEPILGSQDYFLV